MISDVQISPSPVADHELIAATLNLSKPKRQPVVYTFHCLKEYSQNYFCNLLLEEDPTLNKILQTDDVNTQVKCLITRPSAPWITDDIKAAMKDRDQLRKCIKANNFNMDLRHEYKAEKKRVKSLIDRSKKQYYREKIQNSLHGKLSER